ncbi:MAG: EscC/YscC/HrcC family type III secretion system outer membrane ring protein [Burkholderiales bacterium PBB2]|nr:MAG: EscC/YscC/HrcC family type III secretion system outer membrane ring protein [Burkholderiales bacterium PBB2]
MKPSMFPFALPPLCASASTGRALLLGLLVLASPAQAVPWPVGERLVTLSAREQGLDAFLEDLFAQVEAPVALSAGVRGQVNGRFSQMPAQQLLREIARAYKLLVFHDGNTTHIANAREAQQRSFSLNALAAQKLLRSAEELQLVDAQNSLRRSADGAIQARGHAAFIEMVAELARALDPAQAPAKPSVGREDFRVYYLRYAWAQDVNMAMAGRSLTVPGVASILRALVGAAPSGVNHSSNTSRERPSNQAGLRGQGLAAQGLQAGSGTLGLPPAGASNAAASGRDADALKTALAPRSAAAEPSAESAGPGPRIEADPRLNAIIVRDQPEKLERYAALIQALDVEPQALEIEATVIDINTDRLRELGINWRWSGGGGSELLFGRGTASDLALRGDRDVTPSGRGGFVSAVLGNRNQFVARINALQGSGAAKVVSSPQVLTLSNVEAVFDHSSTFYVRVAGREQVDLFNITAGTSLRVMPHVFVDKERTRIKLLVQVEDGNVTPNQVDQIPVVERATIQTQALIGEGESLLIGGMVRDSSSSGQDKVPVLGDLPLLGSLFRSQSEKGSRVERMFLITPRLASAGRLAAAESALGRAAEPSPAPAASDSTAPPAGGSQP